MEHRSLASDCRCHPAAATPTGPRDKVLGGLINDDSLWGSRTRVRSLTCAFPKAQAKGIVTCDLFHVGAIRLRRLGMFFTVEHATGCASPG